MTSHPFRTAALVAFSVICTNVNGQARLNDTGVMQAYGSGGLWPCTTTNTGDAAPYPRQDCRFGRDAIADAGTLSKIGGGPAGFDWTPLDANGQVIPIVNGIPSTEPVCVRDNVTNLMWEGKTSGIGPRAGTYTYRWYDTNSATNGGVTGFPYEAGACGGVWCDTEHFVAAVNSIALCGVTGWRMPTRRELMTIVQSGLPNAHYDANYFPNSGQNWYWTSESYRGNPVEAWVVTDGTGRGQKNAGAMYSARAVRTLP